MAKAKKKVKKNFDKDNQKDKNKKLEKAKSTKKKNKKQKKNKTKSLQKKTTPQEKKVSITAVSQTLDRLVELLVSLNSQPLIYKGEPIYQAELAMIGEIYKHQPVSLTELASLLGITKSAVLKTTNKLNRKELVTKEKAPHNRRVVELRLSEDGEAVQRLIPTWVLKRSRPVISTLENLNESELASFNDVLERILMNTVKM